MPRVTYVQLPNGRLVDKRELQAVAPERPAGPMVMPDIQPYKSMITGEMINSRSTHRAHLRDHGCIEVGNERPRPQPAPPPIAPGLRQELIARLRG